MQNEESCMSWLTATPASGLGGAAALGPSRCHCRSGIRARLPSDPLVMILLSGRSIRLPLEQLLY